MNKFSPASKFQIQSDTGTPLAPPTPPRAKSNDNKDKDGNNDDSSSKDDAQEDKPDTNFDFGDLVTMTIIDVFETDNDGK